MATKKTTPGNGIMKYAPKAPTAKPTGKPTGKPAGKTTTTTTTSATGGKKTTSYVGKPTTSTTGGKKTTTATPSTGSKTTTTQQKSTDPNRYFVGERRGTAPTQEVTYGQYQKARTNPALATVKINKADTAKINNLTRNYGSNEVKGFVKKKVK